MKPTSVLRLDREAFGATAACLGWQLGGMLTVIGQTRRNLQWYAADVHAIGPWLFRGRSPEPARIGDHETTVRACEGVSQFASAVFAGVLPELEAPVFRAGGLWTEDEEGADLGDSLVEIRAFDATYWSVESTDLELMRNLERRYGVGS